MLDITLTYTCTEQFYYNFQIVEGYLQGRSFINYQRDMALALSQLNDNLQFKKDSKLRHNI